MARALDGIKVLDLGRILSGPYATQLLADLGAEVVKVERPGGSGDEMRAYGPPFLKNAQGEETAESAFYIACNRNKKAICVDMATPQGQDIIRGLAAQSDVLLENFKVGDLARYGLDYASIRQVNPAIVYCSLTGFGQTGPYATKPGQDLVFQALSGAMSLTGELCGPPIRIGMAFGDIMAGMTAAYAILAALYHRDAQGGAGQHIDIGILDATVAALSHRAMAFLLSGDQPMRLGNMTAASFPAQDFACSDGAIMLQASQDAHFARFCAVIGRPEIAADARYKLRRDRFRNRHEILGTLQSIIAERPVAEWVERFQAANVMCAPINDMAMAFDDPQIRHREMVVEVPHPTADTAKLIRSPVRMSETPINDYAAPPLMGQHTDEILGDRLGMKAVDIERLRKERIVA
ncbi:CaiB/BaiF CoA transferase family protein [Sphingosinicella soli]|uniref:Crotonobetainyl-CoA:carnitine CoA-transferase CaiB-like acyl-CoA transferase n=1 Tax=Sphingosinicella soli TaxID=333708 RepID=A0A7W7B407_9SPHN|nr:CoA transferase [Sphingosinicella soli]MBB4632688.1 crotonobetainyl-CoA:carnitine CoA-transferase CaiB-like acyl-CoA transferase [Sphingosinicella soli]